MKGADIRAAIAYDGFGMIGKARNIVLLVTLDTKAEEALYVKELIRKRGHNPLVMDVGTGGETAFQADYSCEELALASGRRLKEIKASTEQYSEVLAAVAMGAKNLILRLVSERKIDGLLSIGGSLGTNSALMIMRELPMTLPKLTLSTIGFVSNVVGVDAVSLDQTMMQSPADLCGLNRITRMSLKRAVNAICGMAEGEEQPEVKEAEEMPLVAITSLGVHHYVERCKSLLLANGYEPIAVHTVGVPTVARLIRWGELSGVLDLSFYELVNYVCGGVVKGGKNKYVPACEKGVPQVIGPGSLDFFPLDITEALPPKFKTRTVISHGLVYLIKTTPQEQETIATMMADMINQACGPTVVLVPLNGFSHLDHSPEMPFYDPEAGRRFSTAVRKKVANPLVEIEEIEAHINDPVFAQRATALLLSKMKMGGAAAASVSGCG